MNFAVAQYANGAEFVFKEYNALNGLVTFFYWIIKGLQLLHITLRDLTRC